MNYELAKQLKDAGFPQPFRDIKGTAHGDWIYPGDPYAEGMEAEGIYRSTLSELIEACGESFILLEQDKPLKNWKACGGHISWIHCVGETPEEAVANLWLALNPPSTNLV